MSAPVQQLGQTVSTASKNRHQRRKDRRDNRQDRRRDRRRRHNN